MKISGNEIKPGMLLEHKNDLWEVLKTQHVKPGKGGAFNQVEMKSVNKKTKLNERFRSSDTVEKASIEEINLNPIVISQSILRERSTMLGASMLVKNAKDKESLFII